MPVSDTIWKQLLQEIRQKAESEPILASYLHATVLNHKSLEDALSFGISEPFLHYKGFHALEAYRVGQINETNSLVVPVFCRGGL